MNCGQIQSLFILIEMEQDAFANVVLAWCLDESGGLLTFTRVCYARNNERIERRCFL